MVMPDSPPDTLDKLLLWLVVGVLAAAAMEPWAAVLHRRLWHGPLWFLHRSHHEPREGMMERNDAFALLHAVPAVALILYGCLGAPGWLREVGFGVGLGMTAFGLSYMLVHDGLVHRRLPVSALGRIPWLYRVAAAHQAHHRTGGFPYGLFLGPQEARRASRASRASRR